MQTQSANWKPWSALGCGCCPSMSSLGLHISPMPYNTRYCYIVILPHNETGKNMCGTTRRKSWHLWNNETSSERFNQYYKQKGFHNMHWTLRPWTIVNGTQKNNYSTKQSSDIANKTMKTIYECLYNGKQGNSVTRDLPANRFSSQHPNPSLPRHSYLYPYLALFTLTKCKLRFFYFWQKHPPPPPPNNKICYLIMLVIAYNVKKNMKWAVLFSLIKTHQPPKKLFFLKREENMKWDIFIKQPPPPQKLSDI